MKIECDINRLVEHELSADEYIVLCLMRLGECAILDELWSISFQSLEERGWIEDTEEGVCAASDGYVPSDQFNRLFPNNMQTDLTEVLMSTTNDVESWINDWLELWPTGIKSGSYLVKSDKKGCQKKMIRFKKENPEFNKDTIFKATKNYLNRFERQGWNYVMMATYFIDKQDKGSTLAVECMAVINNDDEYKPVETTI